jgi:hypothetical protein
MKEKHRRKKKKEKRRKKSIYLGLTVVESHLALSPHYGGGHLGDCPASRRIPVQGATYTVFCFIFYRLFSL